MAGERESVDSSHEKKIDEQTSSEQPVAQSFTVEVLQIIKEAQQQHGLRHGDYQRYRGYCSRRIRRIRKSLHFPQGSKYKVLPKKIKPEMLTDVRYLHLPLFCAERTWAYAMELKSEANTELRKKYHMLSRMKKAVEYSEELAVLCESPHCDAKTKLESQAYNAWMKGNLNFMLEKWEPAIELYSSAKTVYEKLASAFTEDLQAMYVQKVEEISPNIRYCAYNIGDESALRDLQNMRLKSGEDQLTSKLDELLSQTREKQASTLSEISWRGRMMPIKVEAVRVFLLNLQESSKELESTEDSEAKVSIYESLLKQCIDAQQALRDTLQEDPNFKAALRGQPVEGKISNQHYLHSYLTYLRLTKTIERNLLLIDNLKKYLPGKKVPEGHKITKPQDLVRLYDIIIQNLNDIPSLHGLEEDPTLTDEVTTRVLGFKAFRSFYIAQSYATAKKWTEAIGLYQRVLDNAQQAIKGYKSLKGQGTAIKNELSNLESLIQEVNGSMYSCHAFSILKSDDNVDQIGATATNDKKPLSERLDQYVEDKSLTSKKPNLIPFPPDFQPIPCRPLYFDLALNHLDFPVLDDKIEQKKAGGGLTGFVKGWLSWGGKN
ncbi:signal recognition particle subunit SRP68-like [Gigantopelta aegis]|uniref:signal recognition particle subunit SRP68-like n=1 Tax=Gigantopelta aegis TaxID=1735272 RepID=UPI001B88E0B3|nr:signal recognition particle subunit SRP68-like [Gigantopelta aegis]